MKKLIIINIFVKHKELTSVSNVTHFKILMVIFLNFIKYNNVNYNVSLNVMCQGNLKQMSQPYVNHMFYILVRMGIIQKFLPDSKNLIKVLYISFK